MFKFLSCLLFLLGIQLVQGGLNFQGEIVMEGKDITRMTMSEEGKFFVA